MFRNNFFHKNTVGESEVSSLLQKEKSRSAKSHVLKKLFQTKGKITNPLIRQVANVNEMCLTCSLSEDAMQSRMLVINQGKLIPEKNLSAKFKKRNYLGKHSYIIIQNFIKKTYRLIMEAKRQIYCRQIYFQTAL